MKCHTPIPAHTSTRQPNAKCFIVVDIYFTSDGIRSYLLLHEVQLYEALSASWLDRGVLATYRGGVAHLYRPITVNRAIGRRNHDVALGINREG